MKKIYYQCKLYLLRSLLFIPFVKKYHLPIYRALGMSIGSRCFIANDVKIIGDYSNIKMDYNTSIYNGGMVVANNKVYIGENTGIAHQVLILTSSNPRGPKNKLSRIYKKKSAPVSIGHNCWIGARVTILPGVSIGNYCVVAAGTVVTKNIPDYSVVAGVPAKIVKVLDAKEFD